MATKAKTGTKTVRAKSSFKFGGIEISVLNQDTPYVPAFTSPIKLTKEHERAIAVAVAQDLPALLIGETGTGKTSIVRELAYLRKQGYTRINMNGYTTPDELIGSKSVKNGSTYYEDGILTKAMKEGHIVVLDEINATPPDCSFILHGLLDDDKRVALPNGDIITPHQDFRVFATMNPDYEGTRSLNRAFLDRFSVILMFDIPAPAKEQAIIMEKGGVTKELAEKMVTVAHMARKAYTEQKTLTFLSTRSLLQWANLIINGGMNPKPAFETSIVNKARKEEHVAFKDFYNAVFKDKPEEQDDAVILTSKRQIDNYERQIRELRDVHDKTARTLRSTEIERDDFKTKASDWETTATKALSTAKKLQETLEKIGAVAKQTTTPAEQGEQAATEAVQAPVGEEKAQA